MLRTDPHPAAPGPAGDRTDRLLAAIRVTLVAALTALVLAIAALAYVVSFEAIRAFAIETAAFPPALAWSAPLLVDSFTTAASSRSVRSACSPECGGVRSMRGSCGWLRRPGAGAGRAAAGSAVSGRGRGELARAR